MKVKIELDGDRDLLERISWWIGYNAIEDYIDEDPGRFHLYVPWTEPRLIVDTALLSAHDAVSTIEKQLEAMSENGSRSP